MSFNFIFKIIACLILISIVPLISFSSVYAQSANSGQRLLVKFKSGVDRQAVVGKYNARIVAEIPKLGTVVIESDDVGIAAKLAKERIEYVEKDAVATTFSNDTLYASQWALPKIKWDLLSSTDSIYNPSSPSTLIAVIDTGVDYTHPDLTGKVDTANDRDFVNNDYDAMDDNLHGTHVAGIAAAATNNSTGIAGVSINTTRILPVKVLNSSGSGYYSWIASGIVYAADHGAKVINLSLGGNVSSSTLEDAVDYAWDTGIIVVAAAGNSGNTSKTYPGAYSNAMAVWASTQTDSRASFSSYGGWVDVGAPGASILSTIPFAKDTSDGNQNGYYLANGTSMATPHVAGLAGLLFSQHPAWSASDVRDQIEATADPVPSRDFSRGRLGEGRINVYRALTE